MIGKFVYWQRLMKKFIANIGYKLMVGGLTLCLLLSAWVLPVEAGTLQDMGKTGKKAAKDVEKVTKDAAKDAEKGVKDTVKGTEKTGKDTTKGIEKGTTDVIKGTGKSLEKGKDAAKDIRIPGLGKGKKGGRGGLDEEPGVIIPGDDEDPPVGIDPEPPDEPEPEPPEDPEDVGPIGDGQAGEGDIGPDNSMDGGDGGDFTGTGDGEYEGQGTSSREEREPFDLDKLRSTIPGFTPSGKEDSGSTETSTIEGGKPWYEKLGRPGGGQSPSSDEDEDE